MTISLKASSEELCRVIPVEFSDLQFSHSEEQMDSLVQLAGAYFGRQSIQDRTFTFELTPTVSLTRPYAYYGANSTSHKDARIAEAVLEAGKALNAELDFSETDYILIITAGSNESWGAGEDYFWPEQKKLSDFNLSMVLDGRRFDDFAVCTELGPEDMMSGIGDFCHEFGHLIGLKDLYDTDGEDSGGVSPGLAGLALMDTGNRTDGGKNPPDLCCVEYDQLDPERGVPVTKGLNRLAPSSKEGAYQVLLSPVPGKYDLLENRGTDEMFIVRVDRSSQFAGFSDGKRKNLTAAERWQYNEVNCRPDHQCAELARPTGDGVFSGDSLAITNIRREGEDFVFYVLEPVILEEIKTFQDGAFVQWSTEFGSDEVEQAGLAWWKDEEEMKDCKVERSADGHYAFDISGLEDVCTYTLSVHITTVGGHSFYRNTTFRTEPFREGASPFIIMDSPGRNIDGTFQPFSRIRLKVRNARDAASTSWTFNGRVIEAGADGFWTIPGSGELKARIQYEDGSEDLLVKKIMVL